MSPDDPLPAGRVCDRCIRKKVKCDLQRPCSRCSETGDDCVYATERRKPGPPRGAKRQRQANPATDDMMALSTEATSPSSTLLQCQSRDSGSTLANSTVDQGSMADFDTSDFSFSLYVPTGKPPIIPGYSLDPSQERDMLIHFFEEVHAAIPLFQRSRFMDLYDAGAVCRSLVVTMTAITARILGPISYWDSQDIDICIQTLLASELSEAASSSEKPDLQQFRKESLLAYYEFHQSPGPAAWMSISKLARKAHVFGLNQIENPDLCSAFDANFATEDLIEDWRYVWWCVYRLDSYSNITTGAPFVVDAESVNTALVSRSLDDTLEAPCTNTLPKLLLADELCDLWKTVQEVISRGAVVGLNIHLITTALVRRAGNLLRLRTEKGPGRVRSRIDGLKSNISSFRLALPPRYLNPTRNTLGAESGAEHHLRLTNVLLLHLTCLITSLPDDLALGEEAWLEAWQNTYQAAEDIATVAKQWDNQYSPQVDPAICFIIFSALVSLGIHRRGGIGPEPRTSTGISQNETVLLLFLEQFGNIWDLPKKLAQFVKDSHQRHHEPLTFHQVNMLLGRLKTPMHPRFHKYSSSNTEQSNMSSLDGFTPDFNFDLAPDDFLTFR